MTASVKTAYHDDLDDIGEGVEVPDTETWHNKWQDGLDEWDRIRRIMEEDGYRAGGPKMTSFVLHNKRTGERFFMTAEDEWCEAVAWRVDEGTAS